MRQLEEAIALRADALVTVSGEEADLLSTVEGHCPIDGILPTEPKVNFTSRSFAERRDMGYVAGWLAGPSSPNADGLQWFVAEVLPRVTRVLPWVRVRVTGGSVPPAIRALASPNVVFEGQVADLEVVLRRVARGHRAVAVRRRREVEDSPGAAARSPGRFDDGRRGRRGDDGVPVMDVTDDPDAFARCVVTLLTDSRAWNERRSAIAGCSRRGRRDRHGDAVVGSDEQGIAGGRLPDTRYSYNVDLEHPTTSQSQAVLLVTPGSTVLRRGRGRRVRRTTARRARLPRVGHRAAMPRRPRRPGAPASG